MGSQITLTISLVMVTLFAVAIMGFAIGFAKDTEAVMSITDDPEINIFSKGITPNLSAIKSNAEGTYSSILDTTIEPGSDVAQSSAPFAVSVKDTVGIGKNIIFIPYQKIFGSGAGFGIFVTIFGSLILFLFALFLYKTLKGNP